MMQLRVVADMSAAYAGHVFHHGDVLRKWREQRKWTTAKLATEAEVDKNTVTRAEKGLVQRTDTLEKIVHALKHSMPDLHVALEPWRDTRKVPATAKVIDGLQSLDDQVDSLKAAIRDLRAHVQSAAEIPSSSKTDVATQETTRQKHRAR